MSEVNDRTKNEKPLSGLKVLVTRAEAQSDSLVEHLSVLGAQAICQPLISFGPPDSWEEFDQALQKLASFDWVVFASANAVSFFAQRLQNLSLNLDSDTVRIATIGPATSAAVAQHGWSVHFQPGEFIAEGLVKTFPGYPELFGVRVLWPKTNIGRLHLAEELRTAGARVTIVQCYQTTAPRDLPEIGAAIARMMREHAINVITLASAQTAKNLASALSEYKDPCLFDQTRVVTIGPETAKAFQSAFPNVTVHQASSFTVAGMLDCLCKLQAAKSEKHL